MRIGRFHEDWEVSLLIGRLAVFLSESSLN